MIMSSEEKQHLLGPSSTNKNDAVVDFNPPITFSWENITIQTKVKSDNSSFNKIFKKEQEKNAPKLILNGAFGCVKPGQVMAIMGASGAGKTTLLNGLTFRNLDGVEVVSGTRYANGIEVTSDSLVSVSAYVQQADLFLGALTVHETLLFQAKLRMETSMSKENRKIRVEQVMDDLGLTKCRNTTVGIHGIVKGISGGELKRLSFACEVLTNPQLLFCDEPTSGLDSFMAYNVVDVLRLLAKKGKTVVCTIHQPSSAVFELFDSVLLMAEGRVAYLGSHKSAEAFFTNVGYPCPIHHNLAEHFVNVLAVSSSDPVGSKKKITTICNAFEESNDGVEVRTMIEFEKDNSRLTPRLHSNKEGKKKSPFRATVLQQFEAVLWRSWLTVIKNPRLVQTRIIQAVVTALVLGIVFIGQNYHTQEGAMNVNGAILLMLIQMSYNTAFAVVEVFCLEIPVFLRERFNGMYRTEIYYVCKQLAEFPFFLLTPILFITIFYWLTGLNPDWYRFFIATLILILNTQVVMGFGYTMSCCTPSIGVAMAIAPAILGPLMLFAGFFVNPKTVPASLRWLEYLSWFKYSYELLLINQWVGVKISCDTDENGVGCLFKNGRGVLEYYGMSTHNIPLDVIMLFVLLISFRVLGYLALWSKTVRK